MDLSKFFDRVGHDVLMARVARKVRDKTVLQLIGRYLRAGVMVDGHFQATTEGTPQGDPASPLLANILLDDLDKELEHRGLRFVRYADDFVIFMKTKRSAERVFASVHRYLTSKLHLVVNLEKSRLVTTEELEYLGFRFVGSRATINVSQKSIHRFKHRIREITGRSRGIAMDHRLRELARYVRGSLGSAFGLSVAEWSNCVIDSKHRPPGQRTSTSSESSTNGGSTTTPIPMPRPHESNSFGCQVAGLRTTRSPTLRFPIMNSDWSRTSASSSTGRF